MAMRTKTMGTKKPSKSRSACGCGKDPCEDRCTGLECMERPRFFAGQLLTEAELTGQQDYVRAKNRLHNLHLHGWGVVCGLEVTCDECEGWVRVHSGYAIDPCGEDIVLCNSHDFDVMSAIRECRRARRKDDCRPYQGNTRRGKDPDSTRDSRCDGEWEPEEHWCLTLRYVEKEARPTTALTEQRGGCGCGPGCSCSGCGSSGGGAGKGSGGCGCGGSGKSGKGSGKGSGGDCGCGGGSGKGGKGSGSPACEPTRILESYRLELCEHPDGKCHGLTAGEQAWADKFIGCWENLKSTLKQAPLLSMYVMGKSMAHDLEGGESTTLDQTPTQIYHGTCEVRSFLIDLFRGSPGYLHCDAVDQLRRMECLPPERDETAKLYAARMSTVQRGLMSYLVLYLLDCFCHSALPPCGPCCGDDEVITLACLTVRGDRITEICNTSCRRMAGAFPPSMAGIYLGPLMPIVMKLLPFLCCGDLFEKLFRFTGENPLGNKIFKSLAEDDFLRVRQGYADARAARESASGAWAEATAEDVVVVEGSGESRIKSGGAGTKKRVLARYMDAAPEAMTADAAGLGVTVTVEEVDEAPLSGRLQAYASVKSGDAVTAYVKGGKVVGFSTPKVEKAVGRVTERVRSTAAAAAAREAATSTAAKASKSTVGPATGDGGEVAALRREVAALQARLDAMASAAGGGGKS